VWLTNQSFLTILQRPTLHHLQQLFPYNHVLLGSLRPSWVIHRQGNIGISGRCLWSVESLYSQWIEFDNNSSGVLDGCTTPRRRGRYRNLHIWNSEWSLDSFGSCFLRFHRSNEGIRNEIRNVVVLYCNPTDFRTSHLWW
jgi:hypothetical protein